MMPFFWQLYQDLIYIYSNPNLTAQSTNFLLERFMQHESITVKEKMTAKLQPHINPLFAQN